MQVRDIIRIIEKRRDDYFDAQIAGTADDPKQWSEADVQHRIATEYDSLLAEIKARP